MTNWSEGKRPIAYIRQSTDANMRPYGPPGNWIINILYN